MSPLATVSELWRYPVKSMQGERVRSAAIGVEGLAGDRSYALFDRTTGLGVTGRRVPQLLYATASLRDDGGVEVVLPDGEVSRGDDDLSDWLGRAVTLRRSDEPGPRRFESPIDFEHEVASEWRAFNGSPGAFHDLADASVSFIARATLGDWDFRRFRANVLLDMPAGQTENDLVATTVQVGDALLSIRRQLGRCVMTTRPQPGLAGLAPVEKDLDVLRTIRRERGGTLAAGAVVMHSGTIAVGDPLVAAVSLQREGER